MENEHVFEITIYTENQVGLLSSIAGIFTRRSLNIDQLRVFPSGIPGIHKFSLKTRTTQERINNVVLQINKKVDVLKAFCYISEEHSVYELAEINALLEKREKSNK